MLPLITPGAETENGQWEDNSIKNSQTKKPIIRWSKEQDALLIQLIKKQKQVKDSPTIRWKKIAPYFPGKTLQQCQEHFNKTLIKKLPEEEKKQIRTSKRSLKTKWTKEEDTLLINLINQQNVNSQNIDWDLIRKHFITKRNQQIQDHFFRTLKPKLVTEKKRTIPQTGSDRPTKRLRMESQDSIYPSYQSEKSSNLEKFSSYLRETQNTLTLSLYRYERAIDSFKEIRFINPRLTNYQQEEAQFLIDIQASYEKIKTTIETEEEYLPIMDQIKYISNLLHPRIYILETINQNFQAYQSSQKDKEWFLSHNEEFETIYINFLSKVITAVDFQNQLYLKEKDYQYHCYQTSKNLFNICKDTMKNFSSVFSKTYTIYIENLFSNIENQLDLLNNSLMWKSTALSLEASLLRLQEIQVFFQRPEVFSEMSLNPSNLNNIERCIMDRLNNYISLQDFYARQTIRGIIEEKNPSLSENDAFKGEGLEEFFSLEESSTQQAF